MSLKRATKSLNAASAALKKNRLQISFAHILECLNVIPHKSAFSEAEYPTSVILQRSKLEAFANEILATIYYTNAQHEVPIFAMRNASTSTEMTSLAVKSWQIVIEICENHPSDSELQQCHLRMIPSYLSVCNELNKISTQQTVEKILQMIAISKSLYDNLSLERAQKFNSVMDLMEIYCPCNIALLQTISTDILYNCSRPISPTANSQIAQDLIANARAKLLKLWQKQSWKATLKLCKKIAYDNVSVIMKKDLEYFAKLNFAELPERELHQNLRYFEKKLNRNTEEYVYGNALIIEKLIRTNEFVMASKYIQKMHQIELAHHLPVHIQCLELLFMECKQSIV